MDGVISGEFEQLRVHVCVSHGGIKEVRGGERVKLGAPSSCSGADLSLLAAAQKLLQHLKKKKKEKKSQMFFFFFVLVEK